jgi:hypothetical protein
MKPITRSPDSSSSSSSINNNNNNIIIIILNYYYFLALPLLLQFPKGLERLEENIDKCFIIAINIIIIIMNNNKLIKS